MSAASYSQSPPRPTDLRRRLPEDGKHLGTLHERIMNALAVLALIVAGAGVNLAPAQGLAAAPSVDGGAPFVEVKVVNGIAFLNGGANIDEADYLKSRGGEFPLQFVFSGRGGEYGVADKLTLRSGNLELISVPDAGPLLMLKVPPGRYRVEATFKGTVETRMVSVGSNGASKVSWNTLRASD
jgi:hypothetical protein